MGLASYHEDLLTAFLEGKPTVFPRPAAPLHRCPFCSLDFARKKDLGEHLSLIHRGERPVLLIEGHEPARDAAIRQAIRTDDIVVENCTMIRISKSGVALPEDSPDALRALLLSETNTLLEIDLLNKFDPAADPINQFYRLNLRIPEKSALDAVDHDFVRLLASETVHMSDIHEFLYQPSTRGVVRDYADALASYVRGVLVKDGRGGSTLPFSESDGLYGRALETLRDFRRPLAIVICSLVRLASNDFTFAAEKTGFGRLDRCYAVLAPTIGHDLLKPGENEADGESKSGKTVPLCPVDQALDEILDLAERIRGQRVLLVEYRRVLEQPRFTSRDRAKMYVLYGLAALQSNASYEAQEALRQLRNEYPFEAWASRELDKLDE